MFTGLVDEKLLNNLDYSSAFAKQLEREAKENMKKCVVLLMETPEENKVMVRHWFPTYKFLNRDILLNKVNIQSYPEEFKTLDSYYLDIINEMNVLDQSLYDYGLHLHQLQYQHAKKTLNSSIINEISKSFQKPLS